MEADQAAEVLAVAAELDRWLDVTETGARAWALALSHGGVTYDEAMAAVPIFYADPDNARRSVTVADIVRITREIRAEDARVARRRAKDLERAELEAAGQVPVSPSSVPLRDRSDDLGRLIEGFRVRPDGAERWPLTGDADMRRRQRHSPSPEARSAADAASRAKARAIVAESRARGRGSDGMDQVSAALSTLAAEQASDVRD